MKGLKTILGIALATTALGGAVAFGVGNTIKNTVIKAEAVDYSSTIRVYIDLGWDSINYVRVGGNSAGNNTVLTTSNAKYNQSLGKYVLDISTNSTYDKMGCYFNQSGTNWEYQYDGGYIWIDDSKFQPGYEFQIKNINWVADGNPKKFSASVYRIGKITDNVQDSSFYFVDGYSWHTSSSVNAYFWGGTASPGNYPGPAMTDASIRFKGYVGDTEYSNLHVYEYTLSGSAAYVKFSKNGSDSDGEHTGDLRLEANKIYFFGIDENTFGDVGRLLISLKEKLGSYSYKGNSFSKSICHLSESEANDFVDTYDDLYANYGSGVTSSVSGSGLITYNQPELNNTSTGFVSLADIRTALVTKYPSTVGSNRIISSDSNNSAVIVVVVASFVAITSVGLFFIIRKKKHQ